MKKMFFAFVGILFLAVFSSCSLSQQNSSISFSFPSDTSTHLSVFRDIEETTVDNLFFVTFSATGDWNKKQTLTF